MLTIEISALCAGNGFEVAERIGALFDVLVEAQQLQSWPSDAALIALLPGWFVAACAPESTPAEEERYLRWWRELSAERKAEEARSAPWSLSEWLHWIHPEQRPWTRSLVKPDGPDSIRVILSVDGSPSPHGAVDWMLRAAGAHEVIEL